MFAIKTVHVMAWLDVLLMPLFVVDVVGVVTHTKGRSYQD